MKKKKNASRKGAQSNHPFHFNDNDAKKNVNLKKLYTGTQVHNDTRYTNTYTYAKRCFTWIKS